MLLGRANDEYESPRDLIKRLGVRLTEMKRSKSTAIMLWSWRSTNVLKNQKRR